MNRFFILSTSLAALLSLTACGSSGSADYGPDFQVASFDTRVELYDQGLNLPVRTQELPEDWGINQSIASDPNTGYYVQFLVDLRGPKGQCFREIGATNYVGMMGGSFQQALADMKQAGLNGLIDNPDIGPMENSEDIRNLPQFQEALNMASQTGNTIEAWQMSLSGTQMGEPVKGIMYVLNFPISGMRNTGVISSIIVVSPEEEFEEAREQNLAIIRSQEPNPEIAQRKQQISQMVMQRMQAQHQANMSALQQMHNSHQQMMKGLYEASDARHQQWMNSQFGSGSSGGSDYSGHDAFIDQIHEQTSFQDPYTGQTIQQDGQYDYWYTNGMGDYYGTNDPSFNANSLQGNWQSIQPLNP